MKLRILGSAGAEFPNFRPPAFLIDDHLLLDAGTIGSVLTEDEQWGIHNIFITHSHLDHIRGIPALADNIIIKNLSHTVTVHSTIEVITALRDHLFNNTIWPDFTKIPSAESPVITLSVIASDSVSHVAGYEITAIPVNHTVPAVGYLVHKNGKKLLYSGDTGPTELLWEYANGIDAMIIEVSFPNEMEQLALLTKHLTCSLLRNELAKTKELPKRIFITHPKPQYYDIIKSEIDALGIDRIELLSDGSVFNF